MEAKTNTQQLGQGAYNPSKQATRDYEQAIWLLFNAKNKLFEAAGAIDQLGQSDYAVEFKEVADDIRRFLTPTAPRVEKAPARGQRISRQPWKAWDRHGRYLGVFATKREAKSASQAES